MSDTRQSIRESFLTAVFSLLGYVANCDGPINRAEGKRIKFYINKMNLSEEEQRKALHLIKAATRPDFNASQVLQTFRAATTPKLIQILLVHLTTMAKADGALVKKELHAIQWIARELGYKSVTFNHLLRIIYAQDQIALRRQPPQAATEYTQNTYSNPTKAQAKSHSGNNQSHNQPRYQNMDLQQAYEVLGITADMTEDEIRRNFQKLISQYHPDKLVSQGLPPDQLHAATERFKHILAAYEFLKHYRSMYSATQP
ncbi:MAG: co-chaperone DjlA [Cellvibrio sp.]|uniref:co-chaperone DjlA n=1 Tax=Cellvibrio sp. TaxID=1965322 RepID=UPI0031A6B0AB